jgi:lipopolysaccharide transport system ATP-binding protein
LSTPIIEVRNLSKKYHLGAIGATSLREEFSRYWDRLRGVPHPDRQDFWALRDVSFDVQPGEVVGVIGRNGAGKSTLLKILSRITEPTSGSATLRGRVASLLEVGTGFHPELTGRENVFLNGAILGMTRAEVKRKFDEIVAFAEVEQFIDTPVKRYSSGMYVRLAFAVAAHLEPEILIVDEVLAVGDAQFQKKCLGKMQDVSRGEGRTVLFVSHNMAAVQQLCAKAILLVDGTVDIAGELDHVIHSYFALNGRNRKTTGKVTAHSHDGAVELLLFEVTDQNCGPLAVVQCGRDAHLVLRLRSARPLPDVVVSLGLNNAFELRVATLHSRIAGATLPIPAGEHVVTCHLPRLPLVAGSYTIDLKVISNAEVLIFSANAATLLVEAGDYYGGGKLPEGQWSGLLHLQQEWSVTAATSSPSIT